MINVPDEAMDALLVKSLLGEASRAEEAAAQAWIAAAPGNARYADHLRTVWERSGTLSPAPQVNADAAWNRFRERVQVGSRPKIFSLPSRAVALRAAAGLALLVSLGFLARYLAQPSMETISAGEGILAVSLPDGSEVTLNRGATLTYPSRFQGEKRAVALRGEGFFQVAKDAAHPFVVQSGEAEVTVLGTSFNVKTSDAQTEVIVETGTVRVQKGAKAVSLQPGDRALVLRSSAEPQKLRVLDALHNYYRTGTFECQGTPLSRFVTVLSDAFHTDIRITDPALRSLSLKATFRGDTLDEILDVLTTTFPEVQVERVGTGILLK